MFSRSNNLKQSSVAVWLILGCSVSQCLAATPDAQLALRYLNEAVQQMGGAAVLHGLKTIRFEAIGHREMVEQSERPEGPYVVEYDHRIIQWRDLENLRWEQSVVLNGGPFPEITIDTVVAGGFAKKSFNGHVRGGSPDDVQTAQEILELGPERVLLTGLSAGDVRAEPDVLLQGVMHHVIAFSWRTQRVHLYLNGFTALPTEVEWESAYPYNVFWSAWGDVTTRLYYSLWWLGPAGIHYPTQWDFTRNDLPDHFLTITKIDVNPELPADTLIISRDDELAFEKHRGTLDERPLGAPDQPSVEVAKDILQVPGAWNVALVRQTDGIVVIEAPISSGYSVEVLDEAARRWPGVPVKAVVSTSDAWPHVAGVREYVARGIPIYVLDLNVAILDRLVAARRTRFPDLLAKFPRNPKWRVVTKKTAIGSGLNRIELYPLRGETSERQMFAHFPEHKLLYGSDAFQKGDHGYTFPQTVWEVVHAVQAHRLRVDTFFMMHVGPEPWSELPQAIEGAERILQSTPNR